MFISLLSRNHFLAADNGILEKVLAGVGQSLGMGLHAAQFLQPQTIIIFLRKCRFLGQWLTFTLAGYTHIISRICKLGKHTIGAEGGGWSTGTLGKFCAICRPVVTHRIMWRNFLSMLHTQNFTDLQKSKIGQTSSYAQEH